MMAHPARTAILLSVILTAASLFSRPLIPIDETRYLAVAWEMRTSGDYLVPHLNGEVYSHKPPLLFWLINAVWSVTGVEEWSARLVGPLAGLVCLILTAALARRLWPETPATGEAATLILASTSLWMVFASMTMFDTLLTASTLAAILGWHLAAGGRRGAGFALAGAAIGIGLLAKGPVCLIHILPVALFAPLWWRAETAPRRSVWFAGVLGATLLGAAIALAWAVPAAIAGGAEYRNAILWGQTAGRIAQSFAHGRPLWWYVPLVPFLLLPWSWSLGGWRAGLGRRPGSSAGRDAGLWLCGIWIGAAVAILSLISGKQIHYIMPELPALSLLLAHGLLRGAPLKNGLNLPVIGGATVLCGAAWLAWPAITALPSSVTDTLVQIPRWWGVPVIAGGVWLVLGTSLPPLPGLKRVAIVATLNIALLQIAARSSLLEDYDVTPMALEIAALHQEGADVLHDRAYHGEFHFAGRLTRPIPMATTDEERKRWIEDHPQGWILRSFESESDPAFRQASIKIRYRRDLTPEWQAILPAEALAAQTEQRTAQIDPAPDLAR